MQTFFLMHLCIECSLYKNGRKRVSVDIITYHNCELTRTFLRLSKETAQTIAKLLCNLDYIHCVLLPGLKRCLKTGAGISEYIYTLPDVSHTNTFVHLAGII